MEETSRDKIQDIWIMLEQAHASIYAGRETKEYGTSRVGNAKNPLPLVRTDNQYKAGLR